MMWLLDWVRSARSGRPGSPPAAPRRSATRPGRRLRLEALEERWCPAGGVLDPTFNGTGMVALPAAALRISTASVVEADGKIVSVGGTPTPYSGAIVRMNADGSLDSTFNHNGEVILPAKVGTVTIIDCSCVAEQADGKIVVGLVAYKDTSTLFTSKIDDYFGVARFNADGTLDTSFGTSGYWLYNPQVGNSSTETVGRLALLADGSIIVGGETTAADGFRGFAALKLTATGRLDTTYGTGGMTVVHVGATSDSTPSMVVTAAGGVVFCSETQSTPTQPIQGAIAVLTAGGRLDTGFHGTGTVLTANRYLAAAVQGNEIVLAGMATSSGKAQGVVARYTMGGVLDTTFGVSGIYVNPTYPTGNLRFLNITVASDGSLVVGGSVNYADAGGTVHSGFQVVHLSADGVGDAAFGSAGNGVVSMFDMGYVNPGASSLAIGPDGKILVLGTPLATTASHAVFFRFTGW